MAINKNPIFVGEGKIGFGNLLGANSAVDGTGTFVEVFSADTTYGSFVEKIVITPKGTNVATVARIFLDNLTTKILAKEATCLATTISQVAALNPIEIQLNIILPPSFKLQMTLGTAVAAGFSVTVFGGDYSENP